MMIEEKDRKDEIVQIENRKKDKRRMDKFVIVERGKKMSIKKGGKIEKENKEEWL